MKTTLRGFSLLEAILTLFLVFLLLGLCGDLFKEYSTSVNFSNTKTDTLTSIQVAMQSMLDDSRQATSFVSPASVGPAVTTLDLWTLNPGLLNSVAPLSASDNVEVVYYLSTGVNLNYPAGCLLRDSTPSGGTTTTWKVADSVQGLSVTALPSWSTTLDGGVNAVQIQLSLLESNRVVVVTGYSMRQSF